MKHENKMRLEKKKLFYIIRRDISKECEQWCPKKPFHKAISKVYRWWSFKASNFAHLYSYYPGIYFIYWDFKTFNCTSKEYQQTIFLKYLCSFIPHRHSMQVEISRADRWCPSSYRICQSVFVTIHEGYMSFCPKFKAASQDKS